MQPRLCTALRDASLILFVLMLATCDGSLDPPPPAAPTARAGGPYTGSEGSPI
jgi:hypothetical protein